MRAGTTAAWLMAALCAGSARGGAQAASSGLAAAPVPAATGAFRLTGTVADPSGSPVPSAEVALVDRDTVRRVVRSDDNGRFQMEGLASQTVTLRVRRVGFRARRVEVRIPAADKPGVVFVSLEPMAARLNAVNVDEEGDDVTPPMDERLRGFYDRSQSNNFGRYLDESAIGKLHAHYVSEALRQVPGISIKPSRRLGNVVRLRGCGVNVESNERIGPLVWIDGVRMPGAELDEVAQANDVAAVEIYSSFAGIPAQYFDRTAVCGTILVWTKNR